MKAVLEELPFPLLIGHAHILDFQKDSRFATRMTERKVHFPRFDRELRKHDPRIIARPSQTLDQAPHNAVADRNLTLVVFSDQCSADINDLGNKLFSI